MPGAIFYTLTIAAVEPETSTAVCVTFDVPDELKEAFQFKQGQFLTLKAEIDGDTVQRSYSICSGVDDAVLRVGIKRVTDGKFSNFANDHLQAGDRLEVMPPQGSFHTPLDPQNSKRYMCIAAGVGITPILSNIKTILKREPESHVTLLYSNRRSNSVMFKDELSFVKNRYLTRFHWINIMNEEDRGSDVLNGRLDNQKGAALHRSHLIDISRTDEALICGPEAMMSEISRGFRASGLNDSQIHYELFSTSAEDSQEIIQKAQQRVDAYGEEQSTRVTVIADGRTTTYDLATVGQNILDASLNNGLDVPYACKVGVCATCRARVVKGEVDMDITHGLESVEIDDGWVLTCQAHPISDEVVIDFDQ
jgi:ring-1,2-phenylacetyl-CoA epoxidase subunit PaaE